MSDNTEPVTQECDRAAVRACHAIIAAESWERIAHAFAAHRTAAVAKREAEIVQVLSDIASSQHRLCRECEKQRDEEGANAHEHAYEIICAAVVKIQTGGGA